MTLLITGGTGFLGSYLTRFALEQGSKVVVLDRYPDRARIADLLDRVPLIEGDVTDASLVRSVVEDHGIERVAHFAFILGSPAEGRMSEYVDIQCRGTVNVLEAARLAGVKRLIFASSVAAYGPQEAALLTEDLRGDPVVPYGFFKLWGEGMVRHYRRSLGVEGVSLRYGSTYGFGRAWRGSYSSGLFTPPTDTHYMARLEHAEAGKAITMPADHVVADFTYAGDAAQAAWLALTAKSPSYDLYNVSAERLPVGQFTAAMRRALPSAEIEVRADESAGHAHAPLSNRRLVEDLGFSPRYDLDRGLADYLERIAVAKRYASEFA